MFAAAAASSFFRCGVGWSFVFSDADQSVFLYSIYRSTNRLAAVFLLLQSGCREGCSIWVQEREKGVIECRYFFASGVDIGE